MGKLHFRYGAMGSSKTANALMVRYNFLEKGKKVILVKPDIENRDGERTIKSRIGLTAECIYMSELKKMMTEVIKNRLFDSTEKLDADVIIVDEVQFLSENEIDLLSEIVDTDDIPVICYGLRTDFTGRLFEGSKRLMELADVIEEIPTICWCGRTAQMNARVKDGKIVRKGEQIVMGGNESYISLCRKHYREGKINGN